MERSLKQHGKTIIQKSKRLMHLTEAKVKSSIQQITPQTKLEDKSQNR